MTADLRLSRLDAVGNAGQDVELVLTFTTSAGVAVDVSSGVSIYLGGTVDDVTVLTGATQHSATVGGAGNNVATLTLPVGDTRTPMRLVLNGSVVSVGVLSPTTVGSESPGQSVAITVGSTSVAVSVIGLSAAIGGSLDGGYPGSVYGGTTPTDGGTP